ncbi:ExbD/TolR family protein [Vibrio genomosp. F10]|uniref:Biopolymer transporter ExbD n=2 Tax=Vibrio genomosp. F10 TaxID=723171 RepID=A0A1B9R3B3_9VIBR|nr:biopolymer transporter ExbD [Vibrio genomosp. F10]OCH78675.1 biopolymer transporter ExbD [Vibrio genomosp. F10]OEE30712.1 biopolymer transporter ExbD [Vibrio genomosp. F10 str. ZF-129]OEE94031.1 biopolymer transporter ExbD [Vibrio genomosp. F10 str. 9ZC157]OEE96364.1 biopolymer transporter ExbD [Vibrio genomosp. F10 str. 9ZD137]OEF08458.1 biopolymer transporter ExbD [Vibrio genomosp. F10 str. 9ZB36]
MITSKMHSNIGAEDLKPDLTPLLDIIFIVMVFLLLTANIDIKTMDVDIPTTNEQTVLTDVDSDVIAINLMLDAPNWAIEKQTFQDWDTFTQALIDVSNQYPKRSLVIGSDKNVPVEKMLQLLAFMQKNDMNATSIIMDEEK